MAYDRYFPDPPAPAGQSWHAPPVQPGLDPEPFADTHGDLGSLRSGYRRLRRVATFTSLGYFVAFLLLSGFAPDLMSSDISGGLTTGLLLGLLTLPVTLAAIALYERIARDRVDPLAAAIRHDAEQAAAAAAAPRHGRQNRAGTGAGTSGWDWPTGGAHA
ncbi:DUF485 domain-containing protein [Streptomyces formicae]|uniref:DUF485 domain-containing protein n=1 Tax=Streptomyces formicae TaxID=1616117 RepID=A0ABY3WVM8_9ACTN|nr:DUF485 domain-containing protein [Streptomyces formicae]UNM15596.1 DUF485 domain-containing protein [Streptomyces formicae]